MIRLLLAAIAAVLSVAAGFLNLRHTSRGGITFDSCAWGGFLAVVAIALVLMPLYIRDARPRCRGQRLAALLIVVAGVAGGWLNITSLRQTAGNMEAFRSSGSRQPVLPSSAPAR